MTPEERTALIFACAALLVLFIVVLSWEPVHKCSWKNACPHYRIDQQRLKHAAQQRADNDVRKERP